MSLTTQQNKNLGGEVFEVAVKKSREASEPRSIRANAALLQTERLELRNEREGEGERRHSHL